MNRIGESMTKMNAFEYELLEMSQEEMERIANGTDKQG